MNKLMKDIGSAIGTLIGWSFFILILLGILALIKIVLAFLFCW